MKIVSYNLNGVRARLPRLIEYLDEQKPDALCLQEIKANPDQIPESLCRLQGYWCYWHGYKGYSGVGLHVNKAVAPERPLFSHPAFDYENRIVSAEVSGVTVASVYVPNGGKDFPAKMRFLEALDDYARTFQDAAKPLVICRAPCCGRTIASNFARRLPALTGCRVVLHYPAPPA